MAPPYHQKKLNNQVKVGQYLGRASTLRGFHPTQKDSLKTLQLSQSNRKR
jgi:hypothetical protein